MVPGLLPSCFVHTESSSLQHLLLRDAIRAQSGTQLFGHEHANIVCIQPGVFPFSFGRLVRLKNLHLAVIGEL